MLGHAGVGPGVVVDPVSAADHRVRERLPGECRARREVVAVRIHKRAGKRTCEWAGRAGQDRRHRCESRSDIEIDEQVVDLGVGRNVFVAKTQVEGQIRAHAPLVLHK